MEKSMKSAVVLLALVMAAFSTTYHVDSQNGNDASAGTSTGAGAWKTLTKVNATTFGGGDSLLFVCGGVWNGILEPGGSGTPGHPFIIGAYGTKSRPIINGGGQGYAVHFQNQEYIEMIGLEITNIATPNQTDRKGIEFILSGASCHFPRFVYP
jgi:hypothetical protein